MPADAIDSPTSSQQPSPKPRTFARGTLDVDELQECVTHWIATALDYGAESADALKHHCKMLVHDGADAGSGGTHLSCVQNCLIETTLGDDSTGKLFAPMVIADIFPHIDWTRACKEALEVGPARSARHQQERDTRIAAEVQEAEDEPQVEGDEAMACLADSLAREIDQLNEIEKRIVRVAVIRERVRELEEQLEALIPGGNDHLHTRPIEERKPWVHPLNHLGSVNGDLLCLIAYLCEQRTLIVGENASKVPQDTSTIVRLVEENERLKRDNAPVGAKGDE